MAPKKADDASAAPLSADAVRKMKVGDLRAALETRGLDSKGLKADLVARMLEATGQVRREGIRESRERGREEENGDKKGTRIEKSNPLFLLTSDSLLTELEFKTASTRTNTGRRCPWDCRRRGRERLGKRRWRGRRR